MKKTLLRKLNSKRGYSLTEMLATILIMGFVGIIITTGAATVQRVYRKVVAHANAQTALSTTISLMKDQLAFADPESVSTGTTTGQSSTITYKNMNSGEQTITLRPGAGAASSSGAAAHALASEDGSGMSVQAATDAGDTSGIRVQAATDEEASSGTSAEVAERGFVLSYQGASGTTALTVPLLTDSAITSDLIVTFDDSSAGFTWDESKNTITVQNLVAKDLKTGTVQARASFTVRVVNGK